MAYRVDNIGPDAAMRRRVFEFAKAINAPLIITSADAANPAELDKLAEEFEINVALESKGDPKAVMAALEGRGKRMGVSAHLGGWAQAGIKAIDGLAVVKDKLLHITAADRSALNARARVVTLGDGAAGLGEFFLAVYRAGLKPLSITVESTGATEADMVKNLNAFERVMWPAMSARVNDMLKTPAGQIRGGDRLDAAMRAEIDAAIPRQAPAKPARPRKLLVTDIQMYSGHSTIPHGNYMIELMAKYTGAFEATFSNDQELLKYPKIKEFDAVFFNNVCGMVHNDPEVREGILRFVREGGGLGGNHAVTYANLNWPEFADMMGGWAGQHRVEEQVLKIDDPDEPAHEAVRQRAVHAHRRVLHLSALLAVFAREAARADEHRRREVRSRIRRAFQRAQHAARSGLRRGVGEGVWQGTHVLHAARPHDDHVYRQAMDRTSACGDSVSARRYQHRRNAEREGEDGRTEWRN